MSVWDMGQLDQSRIDEMASLVGMSWHRVKVCAQLSLVFLPVSLLMEGSFTRSIGGNELI